MWCFRLRSLEILASLGAAGTRSPASPQNVISLRQLTEKTIVGNFGAIDKEKVISLEPSIVFTTALEQDAIAADLRKLGIKVVSSYPKGLDKMLSEITRLGEIIGKEAEARHWWIR